MIEMFMKTRDDGDYEVDEDNGDEDDERNQGQAGIHEQKILKEKNECESRCDACTLHLQMKKKDRERCHEMA